ncbi:MAG TPA: DUF4384 domain-containing protein [Pyrinomonadaceae bacterium]|jgi:hypothetical protein|nr:DUF4384 domain-containing protein [Pyrinomonadaceae bacterium]
MFGKTIGLRFLSAIISISLTLVALRGGVIATPQDNDIFVGRPVPVATVIRKAKPRRKIGRRRTSGTVRKAVERTPLLAVQLRLYKVRPDGTHAETNPTSQFYAGDRLRLGITANQDGYLTIIHQRGADQDGQILFPTSLIEEGRNDVPKNKEYIVPSNCPSGIKPSDCAYVMPEAGGQELFTVVFSRDLIVDLGEKNAMTPTGAIGAAALRAIEGEAVKQLSQTYGTASGRYAVLIINRNRQDNEEIFARFPLTNRGPSPIRGSVQQPTFVKAKDEGGTTVKNAASRRSLKVAKL